MHLLYKVVQIWPGQTVTCLYTNSPGHIWTTLYYEQYALWTYLLCDESMLYEHTYYAVNIMLYEHTYCAVNSMRCEHTYSMIVCFMNILIMRWTLCFMNILIVLWTVCVVNILIVLWTVCAVNILIVLWTVCVVNILIVLWTVCVVNIHTYTRWLSFLCFSPFYISPLWDPVACYSHRPYSTTKFSRVTLFIFFDVQRFEDFFCLRHQGINCELTRRMT